MTSPIRPGLPKRGPSGARRDDVKPPSRWALFGYAGLLAAVAVVIGGLYCWSHFVPENLFDLDERRTPRINAAKAPGAAPKGMVWIPGGEFYMGIEESIQARDGFGYYDDARYVRMVTVD